MTINRKCCHGQKAERRPWTVLRVCTIHITARRQLSHDLFDKSDAPEALRLAFELSPAAFPGGTVHQPHITAGRQLSYDLSDKSDAPEALRLAFEQPPAAFPGNSQATDRPEAGEHSTCGDWYQLDGRSSPRNRDKSFRHEEHTVNSTQGGMRSTMSSTVLAHIHNKEHKQQKRSTIQSMYAK
eukprot:1138913-Pelagomonas_calceolata.AAC.3